MTDISVDTMGTQRQRILYRVCKEFGIVLNL